MSRRTAPVPVSCYLLLTCSTTFAADDHQRTAREGIYSRDAYTVVKLGRREGPRKLAEAGICRSGNRRHRITAPPNWDSNH